ncbi:outer membrane biosynthesis protein TonB [Prosthecobacter fusiformis]|uniref:Outer membrane biosynthesis protein TonB n=1 Tax=Prosthecobacter fusiformis TaxID=48464 RepID=A0A4R7S6S6_9BACT|nr:TonB C-terminal domain-containing protein [Prosthecobacter fusiformis]TDU73155.1 outer membrane biosynthesis protein TonB [Prosthecobacter fusiformis]
MPLAPKQPPLEPVAAVFFGVLLLHGLGGALIWGMLPLWQMERPHPEPVGLPQDGRYWFSPADYQMPSLKLEAPSEVTGTTVPPPAASPVPAAAAVPAPVVAKEEPKPTAVKDVPSLLADTPLVHPAGPTVETRATSKVITLSPMHDTRDGLSPNGDTAMTMMDVVKQKKSEAEAKQAAGGADMDPVLKALQAGLNKQWNAPLISEVPVLQRDARLAISIGRDGGILETKMTKSSGSTLLDKSVMAAADELKKISESLPASFPKDRYTVEVNFHIE